MNAQNSTENDDIVRAIRVLLPGLRLANYVERWATGSPAVWALSTLSEHVGQGRTAAGEAVDPDVPTAHECRPAGRVITPGSVVAE